MWSNAYSYSTKTTTNNPNSHVSQVAPVRWLSFQLQMHVITHILICTEKNYISNQLSQKGCGSSTKNGCNLKIFPSEQDHKYGCNYRKPRLTYPLIFYGLEGTIKWTSVADRLWNYRVSTLHLHSTLDKLGVILHNMSKNNN